MDAVLVENAQQLGHLFPGFPSVPQVWPEVNKLWRLILWCSYTVVKSSIVSAQNLPLDRVGACNYQLQIHDGLFSLVTVSYSCKHMVTKT